MVKYVAFIRGINVGGVVLKMDLLKKILDHAGFLNIQTYIQSGNAIFESKEENASEIEKKIKAGIFKEIGLDLVVIVKTSDEIKRITSSHPLYEKNKEKNLYVTILHDHPTEIKTSDFLAMKKSDIDTFIIKNDIIYSLYGDGYGKSKFTNNFLESKLSVSGTTRNWNTMQKIAQMLNS